MPTSSSRSTSPTAQALREALKPAHLDYLSERQERMLAGGAVLDEHGRAIGALIIVDADDRADAERFIGDDPFAQGGLFASVRVMPLAAGLLRPATYEVNGPAAAVCIAAAAPAHGGAAPRQASAIIDRQAKPRTCRGRPISTRATLQAALATSRVHRRARSLDRRRPAPELLLQIGRVLLRRATQWPRALQG